MTKQKTNKLLNLMVVVSLMMFALIGTASAMSVTITAPLDNANFFGNTVPTVPVSFNIVNTSALTQCRYSMDGGITNITLVGCAYPSTTFAVPMPFGINTVTVFVKDSALASDSVTFVVSQSNSPTPFNQMNISNAHDILAQPNTNTGGYFWVVMLFMIVAVLFIGFLVYGWEVALMASHFAGLVLGIILLFSDLISYRWLGYFAGVLIATFLYIIYMNRWDN